MVKRENGFQTWATLVLVLSREARACHGIVMAYHGSRVSLKRRQPDKLAGIARLEEVSYDHSLSLKPPHRDGNVHFRHNDATLHPYGMTAIPVRTNLFH